MTIIRTNFNSSTLIIVILTIVALTGCWMSPNANDETSRDTDDFSVLTNRSIQETGAFNNFITSVYQAAAADKQALVDSFLWWADSATGIPYMEDSTAYFLYVNGGNVTVKIAGDFSGWDPGNQTFIHLSGTNLYYRSQSFENDARLDYKLVVNDNWILDPLNPHHCSGGFGPNSELSMPGYIQPPEIQSYAIPHGNVFSTTFSDTTQGRTRNVGIYTPPGYEESDLTYRTMYFLDGSEYLSLAGAANILDYMIAEFMIPPIVAVFTDPTDRMAEYSYDYDFMAMFVNELVPWIDAEYRTMDNPEARGITGVSLGGLTSLLFTLHHPDVFGNCGAYSSAIWFGNLVEQYANSADVLPVKIYLDAGTYESSALTPSSALQEILANQGWDHQWEIWHEGHSWGSWRAHLDNSLTFFWPLSSTGIDDRY